MNTMECYQQRKFINQPSSINVELEIENAFCKNKNEIHENSCHGLIIRNKSKIELNKLVKIKIDLDQLKFEGNAVVAFCNKKEDFYEVGLEFTKCCDPFEVKMTLQVCQIKDFLENKSDIKETENEKAMKWIKLNASSF